MNRVQRDHNVLLMFDELEHALHSEQQNRGWGSYMGRDAGDCMQGCHTHSPTQGSV